MRLGASLLCPNWACLVQARILSVCPAGACAEPPPMMFPEVFFSTYLFFFAHLDQHCLHCSLRKFRGEIYLPQFLVQEFGEAPQFELLILNQYVYLPYSEFFICILMCLVPSQPVEKNELLNGYNCQKNSLYTLLYKSRNRLDSVRLQLKISHQIFHFSAFHFINKMISVVDQEKIQG